MKKRILQVVLSLVVLSIVLAAVLLGTPIGRKANAGSLPAEATAAKDEIIPAKRKQKDGVANIDTQVLNNITLVKTFTKARSNPNLEAAYRHLTKSGFQPDFSQAKGAVFTLAGYAPKADAREDANQKAEKIMREGGTLGSFIRVPFSNSATREEGSILYRTTADETFVGVELWKKNKPNKIRVSDVVNKRLLPPATVTVNPDTTASVEWADGTRTLLGPHSHDQEEKDGSIRTADAEGCEEYCSLITNYVCHQVCNWIWTTVCNSVCHSICPIPFICDWVCGWVCNAVQSWVCDTLCDPVTEWVCVRICPPPPPPPEDPLCLDECGTLDCACGVLSVCGHELCSACGGGSRALKHSDH